MVPYLLLSLVILAIICRHYRAKYRLASQYRDAAIRERNDARQECNLLELKLAIVRFTRDHGHLPRSMQELRGLILGLPSGDFRDPYSGQMRLIQDLTGLKQMRFTMAHDITFEYLVPDGPGSERCVLAIYGGDAQRKLTCLVYPPTGVIA